MRSPLGMRKASSNTVDTVHRVNYCDRRCRERLRRKVSSRCFRGAEVDDPQVLRRSLASPRQDLSPASRVNPMASLRESLLCLPLRIRALARQHRRGAPATTGLPSRCLPPPRSPTALKNLRLGRTPHPLWSRFPILGRYVDRESARRTETTARSRRASTRFGSKALPWRHPPPSGARVSERAGKAIPNGGKDPMSGVQGGL